MSTWTAATTPRLRLTPPAGPIKPGGDMPSTMNVAAPGGIALDPAANNGSTG